MRDNIDHLTNRNNSGIIDRNQHDMSNKIIRLQSEIADLHIKLKNTKPKVCSQIICEVEYISVINPGIFWVRINAKISGLVS